MSARCLLEDFVQCLEWLHPDADGSILGPCSHETPERCCLECRYLGCIDRKLRAAKKALTDEETTHGRT